MNSLEEKIQKEGFVIYPFKGTSMLPLLNMRKELVRIEKINQPIKKYDVVLFKRIGNEYVLHRVIDIKDNTYYIVGDNQVDIEEVKEKQIIGIATGKYDKNGYIEFKGKEYEDYVIDICKDIYARKKYYHIDKLNSIDIEFLNLLTSAINGKEYELKCEQKYIYNIATSQQLQSYLFKYLKKDNIDKSVLDEWECAAAAALKKDILYDNQRKVLYKRLEEEKVKYLPLKGIIIKEYYPFKGARQFSDNDILYDKEKFTTVREIMSSLGFDEKSVGYYVDDAYHKDNYYSFEMHRDLFESEYKIFDDYYKNIFEKCDLNDNSKYGYHMNDIDFYIYIVSHMYKHQSSAGIGFRFYLDLYYMRKALISKIDQKELNEKLDYFGIKEFHDECLYFIEQIIKGDYSDIERILFILTGSIYGKIDNFISNNIKRNGKFGYFMSRIFPPLKKMKSWYKPLQKFPILLPIFYIYRLFKNVFTKRNRKNFFKEIDLLNKTKID